MAGGFPVQLARLCITMYAAPRYMSVQMSLSGPYRASRGVIAGCSFATTFTRVHSMPSLDTLNLVVTVNLDVYVDDFSTGATGTLSAVVDDLVDSSTRVHHVLTDDLECNISIEKAAVIASSPAILTALRSRLGPLAGDGEGETTINLGADWTAGRPVREHGRGVRRQQRLLDYKQRHRRLTGLLDVLGTKAHGIHTTGLMPAGVYDSMIYGITDADLLRMRRSAGKFLRPRAGERSLTTLLLLHGDPVEKYSSAPLDRWALEIWRATNEQDPVALRLPELRRMWALGQESVKSWRQVAGPVGAALQTLRRLGWSMPNFATLRNDFWR